MPDVEFMVGVKTTTTKTKKLWFWSSFKSSDQLWNKCSKAGTKKINLDIIIHRQKKNQSLDDHLVIVIEVELGIVFLTLLQMTLVELLTSQKCIQFQNEQSMAFWVYVYIYLNSAICIQLNMCIIYIHMYINYYLNKAEETVNNYSE